MLDVAVLGGAAAERWPGVVPPVVVRTLGCR
jgi:hypothetical protein